jgi:hypothetical protein
MGGSNVGNSSLLPWQTVAEMLSESFPSDTVNWKKGETWREYALDPPTAQTWQNYGSGSVLPRISCMDVVVGTWTNTSGTIWTIPYPTVLPSVSGVDVDGLHYPPAASVAALVAGQFFYDIPTATLYLDIVGGDSTMSGKVVEANGQRHSAMAAAIGQGGYSFTGIHFHGGTDGTVIMQNCSSISSWTSCRFGHGGFVNSVGLLFLQGGNLSGYTVTDCLFENGNTDCLFYVDNPLGVVSYCTFLSLYGFGSDHMQFTGTVNGSGGSHVHHCYGFAQVGTNSAKGMIVQGQSVLTGGLNVHDNFCDGTNYMCSFGGPGLTGFDNYTIDRNVHINGLASSSVGSFGMGGPGAGCRWTYNVSIDNAGAVMNFFGSSSKTGIGFYQNTLFRYATLGIVCSAAADKLSGTIEDNIIWSASSTNNHIRLRDTAGGALVSDYNDIGPEKASGYSYNGTAYNTLALYVAGASQDAHSIKSDPLLNTAVNRTGTYGQTSAGVAATYADVSLTALSPARAAGIRVTGINDTMANPPDLGAFQYGALGIGLPANAGRARRRQRILFVVRSRHGRGRP